MGKAIIAVLISILTVSEILSQFPRRGTKSAKSVAARKVPPCLTRVPSYDEFLDEIKQEWRVATTSSDEIYYYNTRKMVCEKGVLKIWVKTEKIGDDFKRSMARYEVNCHRNQMRTMTKTDYDKKEMLSEALRLKNQSGKMLFLTP